MRDMFSGRSLPIRIRPKTTQCVNEIMSAPTAIPPDATAAEGRWLALEEETDSLVVLRGADVAGVVSLWDLHGAPGSMRVGRLASAAFASISPWTTLDEAAHILEENDAECLVVIVRGSVVGVVTRARLRAAGHPVASVDREASYDFGGSG